MYNEKPGLINCYQHEILLTDYNFFFERQYPIALSHREEVRRQIEEMENLGIIERSPTQYVNPLLTVVKQNGEIRLCMEMPDF